MTSVEDAMAAAELGADAIGLVFYKPSPRHVTIEQARAISSALPPFIARVGLFVDAPAAEVRTIAQAAALDTLQFHGDESAENCAAFGRPYIKAVRMHEHIDVHAYRRRYASAAALLLDASVSDKPGGSGQAFDWGRVPKDLDIPVILAGGLTAANVQAAIRQVRPFAVDVSSGIEARKGVKDRRKMSEFMQKVRECQ
jgi:phosphoribosylanthranilate isomerase